MINQDAMQTAVLLDCLPHLAQSIPIAGKTYQLQDYCRPVRVRVPVRQAT